MNPSRRVLIAQAAAGLVAAPATAAERLKGTPQEMPGPYYPVVQPRDRDADLTRVSGRQGRAKGQIIEIGGRVLREDGWPVAGAVMEIWQANAAGRYLHGSDATTAALDPNFEGYAQIRTAANGRWRITTVKPGAYPAAGGTRTPHIHFQVTGRSYRLTTQMYFPGEPMNEKDLLLGTMAARRQDPLQVIAASAPAREPGVDAFAWDIVLRES